MQCFNFQPDLTKAYPILSETRLILSDNADPNMVQDVIVNDLLPEAFSILGTKVRLILVTVCIIRDIAYWDLIFTYPVDYPAKNLLDHIYDQAIQLDDSFDHFQIDAFDHTQIREAEIHKISFKVG